MSERSDNLHVEALRSAFDSAFAEAPTGASSLLDFLAIGIGGARFAIPLGDTAGIHVDKRVVPLPTGTSELLGIAAFRNALTPIFDLRKLLGHAPTSTPRWIVLARGARPVGLAFDTFEGQRRIEPTGVVGDAKQSGLHLKGMITTAEGMRPIIDVFSVVEVIARRAAGASKET